MHVCIYLGIYLWINNKQQSRRVLAREGFPVSNNRHPFWNLRLGLQALLLLASIATSDGRAFSRCMQFEEDPRKPGAVIHSSCRLPDGSIRKGL